METRMPDFHASVRTRRSASSRRVPNLSLNLLPGLVCPLLQKLGQAFRGHPEIAQFLGAAGHSGSPEKGGLHFAREHPAGFAADSGLTTAAVQAG